MEGRKKQKNKCTKKKLVQKESNDIKTQKATTKNNQYNTILLIYR